MDFAIKQFLEFNQDYRGTPVYNILRWQNSTILGGANVVDIPIDKGELRTFVIIHLLSISTDGLGGVIQIYDDRTPTIPAIEINNNVSFFNVVPFYYTARNNRLRFICSNNNVKFSLAFQTVTQEKQKDK